MTQDKIICFSQKNATRLSVEDSIELQHLLKDIPDEAFPLLMSRNLKNNTVGLVILKILMCLAILFLTFMAIMLVLSCIDMLFTHSHNFVREEDPAWPFYIGCVVDIVALVFLKRGFVKFKIRPYKKKVYEDFLEIITKYTNK